MVPYLILPHLITPLSGHVFSALLHGLRFNFVPDLLRLLCTRVCFVPEVKHGLLLCGIYVVILVVVVARMRMWFV